jgi:ubiquinone/menaquinone biosynthesis C-methylase UbiE
VVTQHIVRGWAASTVRGAPQFQTRCGASPFLGSQIMIIERETDRQQREIEFFRDRAATHTHEASQRVTITHYTSDRYKWWNSYWAILWKARSLDLPHRRVLVVGSGFGGDAITLSLFGAKTVDAIDISEECCKIARHKSAISQASVQFYTSTAENLPFKDGSFDLVYLNDIVHHVNIPAAFREIRRVLQPGGWVLGNEPYTHPSLQAIRNSRVVREVLYPKMVKSIYGVRSGHITEDERKLEPYDLMQIEEVLGGISYIRYFNIMVSRLLRETSSLLPKVETLLLRLPIIGHYLAGRVVFAAMIAPLAGLGNSKSPSPLGTQVARSGP